jgi:methenyltetrahydrofolate cyclohydrolase
LSDAIRHSTISAFLAKLSSADPTPGGGSAAALSGAMGAALIRMVAHLTSESPKFAAFAKRAQKIDARAEQLFLSLERCIDEDVAAFDKVTAAFKLPKSTDDEKAKRTTAIQEALLAAADPPMRVVEASVDVCRLAAELVDFGNPNAVSDVGCAAAFAAAAAQGAAFNVSINVGSLRDRTTADDYERRVKSALAQADLLGEIVAGKVQASIGKSV